MNDFMLDHRLQADCIELFTQDDIHVLLMNNMRLPWFIIVPETTHIELHHLPEPQFRRLMALQRNLARFIESQYKIDKLNIGAIGNVVSQLHVHVIGRRKNDHCWPGVVWGNPEKTPYSDDEAKTISRKLSLFLNARETAELPAVRL